MRIGVLLKQLLSRALRFSLQPWVAAIAMLSLLFYLAIFSTPTVHMSANQQEVAELQGAFPNISGIHVPDANVRHPWPQLPPLPQQRSPQNQQEQQQQQQRKQQKRKQQRQHPQQKSSQQPSKAAKEETDVGYAAFLRKPLINFHNFSYIQNVPDACTKSPIDLVIVSPSGPGNFFRRMMARKSARAHYTRNPQNRAVHLFFIGTSHYPGIQMKVAAEARRFKDIVQESFIDVYANITLKAVQMLKWVSVFCGQSRNVIRLDDDVTADIDRLVHAMAKARLKHPEFILGEVKTGWKPCKIPKCLTSKKEYPYATLPPFALGGALGYPTSSVRRLYEATKRMKRFKLDDVYVTGMCAPKVGVKLLHDEEFNFQHNAW